MKGLSVLCCVLAISAIKAQQSDVRQRPNPEFLYPDGAALRTAIADFTEGGVTGFVKLTQSGRGPVILQGVIRGISPGKHGFHIHENGNTSANCAAAGDHFNPENKAHGDRHSLERHVGDLGNIEANASYIANIAFEDNVIQLTGKHGVVGRTLVIHQDPDDGGQGGTRESAATGSAGRRIACATIRPKFPPGPWPNEENAGNQQSASYVALLTLTLTTLILARVA